MVSYDNAPVSFKNNPLSFGDNNFFPPFFFSSLQSFAAKGKFILDTKLKGFSMWEAGGDANDILLEAIREGAGFNKNF